MCSGDMLQLQPVGRELSGMVCRVRAPTTDEY